jgi:murein L,D-transpeptidase YcbB/YkuD
VARFSDLRAGALALAVATGAILLGSPTTPVQARERGAGTLDASAVADFYRSRGGAPLWFSRSSGSAARELLQLLATSQADNLNPNRYRVGNLAKAVNAASTGNPAAVQRAEAMLSQAFVAYVRDTKHDPHVGIVYVDAELKPEPPSPRSVLEAAASAPSLTDYVAQMRWMNPIYAQLRQAVASRMYFSEQQRRVLAVNLDRARALPAGGHRYVIVNPAAQRLYMYEDGQVVDQMRVVAGRPDPIAQTPMMSAYIRFAALNPYWNSPADITAKRLAPTILKEGRAYFKNRGYELLSDWSDHPRIINPMSIDWHAVAAGRVQARLRQKPGPANSMGKMKFMFPNPQGIWLHDTPEKEKIEEAARLSSNGCVRLADAARFGQWLFGYRLKPQGAKPEQKVPLPKPVPIYITYLTAVPSGTSITYLDDLYGRDSAPVQRRRAA